MKALRAATRDEAGAADASTAPDVAARVRQVIEAVRLYRAERREAVRHFAGEGALLAAGGDESWAADASAEHVIEAVRPYPAEQRVAPALHFAGRGRRQGEYDIEREIGRGGYGLWQAGRAEDRPGERAEPLSDSL